MNLKNRLGKRIKELRLRNNLKQSELAEQVGIATKHQSCIETGKNYPSSELIEKYAKVFNVDEGVILNIQNIQNKEFKTEYIQNILSIATDEEITIIYKFVNSLFY